MKPTNDTNAPAERWLPCRRCRRTPRNKSRNKTKAAAADENWDRLLRTTADFDNFKKRAARERTEAAQNAVLASLKAAARVGRL